MGLFDLEEDAPPAAAPKPKATRPIHHQGESRALIADPLGVVIATVLDAHAHRPSRPFRGKEFRDAVRNRLLVAGWICRTRYKVESRGTPDGYRGVLDLVAHPPPPRGAKELPDPVLVEFDKVSIERKTIAKLARYEGRTAAKLIVLARGTGHHDLPTGVDEILTLG